MEITLAQNPNIYTYKDPVRFLNDCFKYKKEKNRSFSIRAWARQMGFSSHSALVFILTEKRKIQLQQIGNLSQGIKFSTDDELGYFTLLVQYKNSITSEEKKIFKNLMCDISYNTTKSMSKVTNSRTRTKIKSFHVQKENYDLFEQELSIFIAKLQKEQLIMGPYSSKATNNIRSKEEIKFIKI